MRTQGTQILLPRRTIKLSTSQIISSNFCKGRLKKSWKFFRILIMRYFRDFHTLKSRSRIKTQSFTSKIKGKSVCLQILPDFYNRIKELKERIYYMRSNP